MSRGPDGYEKAVSDCGPDGPMCWLATCERCKLDAASWAAPKKRRSGMGRRSLEDLAMQKLTARIKANHVRDHGAKAEGATFVGVSLAVRRDPQTERWVVALVSRTGREDVPVAWKVSEEDALAWAANYGMRK